MCPNYIEFDDLSHLDIQARGGGVFDDRLWRESYYFNMTDSRSGISLLTTIGIMPNKRRTAGFVLLMKNREVLVLKLLVVRECSVFNDDRFELRGLEYIVEGVRWRLKYHSKRCAFDILFTPINNFYPYIGVADDRVFEKIGTQHFEQAGVFEGELIMDGDKETIGPCFGHRDHSWGIRDWSAVDNYRLFCCTFSEKFAFNLWEGSIGGKEFLKGYVFDGIQNTRIIESTIRSRDNGKGNTLAQQPKETSVSIMDEKGRCFDIDCSVRSSLTLPPKQSIMYETIAEMSCNGLTGYGLQEHLHHVSQPFRRGFVFLKLCSLFRGA